VPLTPGLDLGGGQLAKYNWIFRLPKLYRLPIL